jgi:hypothetical protein
MSSTHDSCDKVEVPASSKGFDVLGACHWRTLFTLGKLAALVSGLNGRRSRLSPVPFDLRRAAAANRACNPGSA